MATDSTWFDEGAESSDVCGPCGLGLPLPLRHGEAAALGSSEAWGRQSEACASPGARVLCLKSWLPSLFPHLASTVTAKRKKLGDGCQGNVPTLIPSINHQLPGHRGPCLRRTGGSEVSAGTPNLGC